MPREPEESVPLAVPSTLEETDVEREPRCPVLAGRWRLLPTGPRAQRGGAGSVGRRFDDGGVAPGASSDRPSGTTNPWQVPKSSTMPAREPASPKGPGLHLRAITLDRTRGASELAVAALQCVRTWAHSAPLEGPEGARNLRRAARTLRHAQPAMGAFLRWAMALDAIARRPQGRRSTLLRSLRTELPSMRSESRRVASSAARVLPPGATFVTISRSATVATALALAPRSRRAGQVVVLESLPGGEGREQARWLRRRGVPAGVVPDPEGVARVRDADALLIGADAVFSDGTVWHKVGTRPLAAAAGAAGVPVIVLAGSSKFVPGRAPRRLPGGRFDATPGSEISLFVTEQGPVSGPRPSTGRFRATGARALGRRRAA